MNRMLTPLHGLRKLDDLFIEKNLEIIEINQT